MNSKESENLLMLFEAAANSNGEAIAVVSGNGLLTYKEMAVKVGNIYKRMVGEGITPFDKLVIETENVLEEMVAVFAALKIGASFVWDGKASKKISIDNNLLISIIQKSEYSGSYSDQCPIDGEMIYKLYKFSDEKLKINMKNVIFDTENHSVLRFPVWAGCLAEGGTVRLIDGLRELGDVSVNLSQEANCSTLICPVSKLDKLSQESDTSFESSFNAVKSIISYGETRFNPCLFRKKLKDMAISWYNYLGFPEMFFVSAIPEEPYKGAYFFTGRPITGSKVYILDSESVLSPIGVEGTMFIKEDWTERRLDWCKNAFVQNPFEEKPGFLYKTSYRACWLPDGKITVLGRTDGKFDCGGFITDAESLRTHLMGYSGVNDCCVLLKDGSEHTEVKIYYVPGNSFKSCDFEAHISRYIPVGYADIEKTRIDMIPRNGDETVDWDTILKADFPSDEQKKLYEEGLKEEISNLEDVKILIEEMDGEIGNISLENLENEIKLIKSGGLINEDESAKPEDMDGETYTSIPDAIVYGGDLPFDDRYQCLKDILLSAESSPEGHIVFVHTDGSRSVLTYKDLLTEASKVLGAFKSMGCNPGDKVIFQFNNNREFIITFWGCILGGLIPVPVNPVKSFSNMNNELITLKNIWLVLDKPLIVASADIAEGMYKLEKNEDFKDVKIVKFMELFLHEPCISYYQPSIEDDALIMFTSGSTGVPKGVVLTHKNIISQSRGSILMNNFTCKDVSVNWMPLEHVGGIIFFHIRDVFLGAKQVQVRTEYILANPLSWLDLISEHKASSTWAPCFAYALINDKLGNDKYNWDLSSMRLFLNGGEAVNAVAAQKFLTNLERYGLSASAMHPTWGMSETSSGCIYSYDFIRDTDGGIHYINNPAAFSRVKLEKSTSKCPSYVEIGKPIPGLYLAITDADNKIVKEGVVGKFQVKGLNVTKGYYKNKDLNSEVFSEDGWMDTGDMGFILNGKLTITGRTKDIIIINGVNYSNSEIESVVEEIDGIETSYTAASAIKDKNNSKEELAVFFCSKARDTEAIKLQINEIKKKIIERIGIKPQYVIPVTKDDIPKTSIGKIQRSQLAERLKKGDFDNILETFGQIVSKHTTLPQWFYRSTCELKSVNGKNYKACWGRKAVIIRYKGEADAIISSIPLENAGVNTVVIDMEENGSCSVGLKNFTGLENALTSITQDTGRIDDIIYVASSGKVPYNCENAHEIISAQDLCLFGFINLSKTLKSLNMQGMIRVFAVTKGAVLIEEDTQSNIAGFTIHGFIKSMAKEFTDIYFRHIDLEPADCSQESCMLLDELSDFSRDETVVYRKNRRYILKLQKVAGAEMDAGRLQIKKGGSYLITGGLGGIGLLVTKWLMENFDIRAVVLGRTNIALLEDGNTKQQFLDKQCAYKELKAYGDRFEYYSVDISDQKALKEVVDSVKNNIGADFDGIFHMAGDVERLDEHWRELDKHFVWNLKRPDFTNLFNSKVTGTLNLFKLIDGQQDKLFVAFSSIAGFFGTGTFSAYSAANSFIDNYCNYKILQGYSNIYCLSYAMWENTGMSAGEANDMEAAGSSFGLMKIKPADGVNSMALALKAGPGRIFIGLDGRNYNIRTLTGIFEIGQRQFKVFCSYKGEEDFESDVSKYLKETCGIKMPIKIYRVNSIPYVAGEVDVALLKEAAQVSLLKRPEAGEGNNSRIMEELAAACSEVLGVENVQKDDNFFSLGGDSIKAIQLVSVLKKKGLLMETKDIFFCSSISEMAAVVEENTIVHDQEPVTGPVLLTPVQKWFFEGKVCEKNLFSQYIILSTEEGFDINALYKALQHLLVHHDMLRTRFNCHNGQYTAECLGVDDIQLEIETINLKEIQINDQLLDLEAQKLIHTMDIARGKIVKAAVLNSERESHLILAIHHLVVDGVSWRIIMEDLSSAYYDVINNRNIELSLKTTSFKKWAHELNEYGKSEIIKNEAVYWKSVMEKENNSIFEGLTSVAAGKQEDTMTLAFKLDKEYTKTLLMSTNSFFNTSINELLLTCLAMSLRDYSRKSRFLINLEGHGREEFSKNIDISRTVGWFTSIFPVFLELEDDNDIKNNLMNIKHILENIPQKGMGFGILQYLSENSLVKSGNMNINPEISFNYLGRLDNEGLYERMKVREFRSGLYIDPGSERFHILDYVGVVTDEEFTLSISFPGTLIEKAEIEKLLGFYKKRLVEMLDLCDKEETGLQKFLYDEITEDQLQSLQAELSDLDLD